MTRLVQIRGTRKAPEPPAPAPELPAASELPRIAGPRVYVETLGCQMNEADSALIVGQLAARGYVRVPDPAAADVILLNTCAVREKAEERVYGRTSQLLRHRKDNPDLVFGITGCMAEHLRDKVQKQAPHIGLVAGPDSYRRIGVLVDRARAGERVVDVALDREETYEGLDGVPDDDGVSGQVTIQRGCDKFCTFCVVPYTRGRERGVAPREVLRQARQLAERGYKEIVLLGQTVNSYVWEDASFADLLRALAAIDGVERIRFTSPYPVDFDERLIATMAELEKVCPYIHLPAQSGSDRMLTAMKRGYSRGEFVDLVGRLRAALPDLALSTDLMVGFCGETEDDHAETLSLMREVRFDSAFMFRYSDRGITYAARKLQDDVPDEVKGRRLQEVIELQEQHTRASHHSRVGKRERVLISGLSHRGDRVLGRTPRFQSVLLPLGTGSPGQTVEVEITATTGHSLIAG
ncbi:tRNA-i(6)A37 thiotransferase enzyme MiaB [Nannocystis exedens]|uniref:tRNA-2-methylthio-N(6)-dimethylallyladenosine synthase n=1 Tax=Nannocystis exedens TaxID=54 RepID=A0A1I1ZKH5_9BACT|nr:tRNA (N6-isopentenyl adenosine(37)-C2)-methylthiotransferase MiaB [Nannocystis exedens]PCC75444.1 tRNA-2-methylthio-N(6)-dimethylallyladenosine synthase MiaB [Nannocystis exedens]SFE32334.1 tRNA-i(6)A37 thiotransferase enzyme MiaB [Nannocystis exedens]